MVINKRHFEAINLPASAEAYDYVGFRVVYKDKESYKIGDTPNRSSVYRVERDGRVDFMAKFVREDKEDGKYMEQQIWNTGFKPEL